MPDRAVECKATPLKLGDLSALARRLDLSRHHVALVAKGDRKGSARLEKALARLRAKRAAEAEAARTPDADVLRVA